jgi:uncharacterized FAD-dependent dehydrogenase
MSKLVHLDVSPEAAADEMLVRKLAGAVSGIRPSDISDLRIIRRSVDARKKNIRINLEIEIFSGDDLSLPVIAPFNPRDVADKPEVIIVGSGPAGLFASTDRTRIAACYY